MNQPEFIRRISELPGKLSWFLGAGTSQSAGLPTASELIWNLRRRYYCSEEQQEITSNDLQNSAVRDKINAFMMSRGHPETSDSSAYSQTFELIFGQDYDRQRRHLEAVLSEKNSALTQGHRIFAALISLGAIKTVFTTNFDTVVERALAETAGKAIAPFHIEGSYAANDAINDEEYPVYVKLHGDFRYRSLKNLSSDLQAQNDGLGKAFINAASRFGFVVAGYSGRDESVMRLFNSVLATHNPFPHGLYWTGLKGRPPTKAVQDLLDKAQQRGVDAEFVEIETFDALMSRIWKQVPEKPIELSSKIGRQVAQAVVIPLPGPGKGSLLRLNALPIVKLPDTCLKLTFDRDVSWKDIREAERLAKGELICTKGQSIFAWGSEGAARHVFGSSLISTTEANLKSPLENLRLNLHLKGFVERSIGRGLCRGKPLLHRESRTSSTLILDRRATADEAPQIFECVKSLHGKVHNLRTVPSDRHPESEDVFWAEALQIELDEIHGNYWLILKPIVWIWPRHARLQAADFLDKRVGGRFNDSADQLLSAWLSFLFPSSTKAEDRVVRPFEGPEDSGHPSFTVNTRTAFSRRIVA